MSRQLRNIAEAVTVALVGALMGCQTLPSSLGGYTSPNADLPPELIKAAQARLEHEGFLTGPPGQASREFDDAVRAFQAKHDVAGVGQLTSPTAEKLAQVGVGLAEAARRGDAPLVDRLLGTGADPNAVDASGWTPLLAAVGGGNLEVVRRLIGAGADVNKPAADGMTPILLAVLAADRGTAQLLADYGADARATGPGGLSAIEIASKTGDTELAKVIASRPKAPRDAVARAAAGGDAMDLQMALAAGALVDAADSEGWTGLMHAAYRGDRTAAERLLAAGADPNKTAKGGLSALHIAAAAGKTSVVELLLGRGAATTKRNAEGATPAILALAGGHPDIARQIVAHAGPDYEASLRLTAAEREGIERLLEALGYGARAMSDPGRQAVRSFQSSRQLAVTGYIDELTLQELGRAVPSA